MITPFLKIYTDNVHESAPFSMFAPYVFPFTILAEIFGWSRNSRWGFGFSQTGTGIYKLEFGFGLTGAKFQLQAEFRPKFLVPFALYS